jgi:HNH endonuclease
MYGKWLTFGVEAAHIIPWSKALRDERVSLENGILLNVSFHRAFEGSNSLNVMRFKEFGK